MNRLLLCLLLCSCQPTAQSQGSRYQPKVPYKAQPQILRDECVAHARSYAKGCPENHFSHHGIAECLIEAADLEARCNQIVPESE